MESFGSRGSESFPTVGGLEVPYIDNTGTFPLSQCNKNGAILFLELCWSIWKKNCSNILIWSRDIAVFCVFDQFLKRNNIITLRALHPTYVGLSSCKNLGVFYTPNTSQKWTSRKFHKNGSKRAPNHPKSTCTVNCKKANICWPQQSKV